MIPSEEVSVSNLHRPLFVVGCGRSGTTMLRLMLDSNPEIAIPNESHFIPAFWAIRHRYMRGGRLDAIQLTKDIMKTRHFRLWKVPQENVLQEIKALDSPTFSEMIHSVFLSYAKLHGRIRWGDKTPKYVLFIPLLANLFPDSLFVHLIRDGRNVVLSYLSLPWGPGNIWKAAWKWRRDVTAGRTAGKRLGSSRYLELRYESLVEQPQRVLEKVCDFAGIPYSEKMLEYHRDGSERLQWPDGMRFHASSTRPPAVSTRDWRSQMTADHQMCFEAVTGDLLTDLGYERQFSKIPIPRLLQARLRSRYFLLQTAAKSAKRKIKRRFTKDPVL